MAMGATLIISRQASRRQPDGREPAAGEGARSVRLAGFELAPLDRGRCVHGAASAMLLSDLDAMTVDVRAG